MKGQPNSVSSVTGTTQWIGSSSASKLTSVVDISDSRIMKLMSAKG